MGRQEQYTKQEVIDALKESRGILTSAAKKLGCSRPTVYRYIQTYDEVKEAYHQESEKVVDYAEMKFINIVQNEAHQDHFKALRFMLSTKGRHRGYSERVEYDLSGLDAALGKLGLDDLNFDKLDKNEIKQLIEIIEKAEE